MPDMVVTDHKGLSLGPRPADDYDDPRTLGKLDDLLQPGGIDRPYVAAPGLDDEPLERGFVAVIVSNDHILAVDRMGPGIHVDDVACPVVRLHGDPFDPQRDRSGSAGPGWLRNPPLRVAGLIDVDGLREASGLDPRDERHVIRLVRGLARIPFGVPAPLVLWLPVQQIADGYPDGFADVLERIALRTDQSLQQTPHGRLR